MTKKQKTKSPKELLELAWVQYLKENDDSDFYQVIHQLAIDFNEMDEISGVVDAGLIPIHKLNDSLDSFGSFIRH